MIQRRSHERPGLRCATAVLAAAVVLGAVQSAWGQPSAATTQAAPPAVEPLPQGTLTAAQIQLKLDEPVAPMTMDNAPLIDVLRKLEGKQARWLDLPGATLSFLPYGEETAVTMGVPAGKKVREVLDSLLDAPCLTYRIIEDERGRGVLRIVPRAELSRVGRRATIDELELLYKLRHLRIASVQKTLAVQLSEQLKRPINIVFDLSGMDAAAATRRFNDSLAGMAENTAAGLLNQFCLQGNWTWRVGGGRDETRIIIVDQAKQVVHQLKRHVSVRWVGVPLDRVLVQLSNSAGVTAQFQPGLMENIDAGSRLINGQIADESITQIIETLSAQTGIAYEVRDQSIYFFSQRRAGTDPVIGQVSVGTRSGRYNFQLYVRKSMLTKEAQAAVDQVLKQVVDEMNRELTGPGTPNPSTWPK